MPALASGWPLRLARRGASLFRSCAGNRPWGEHTPGIISYQPRRVEAGSFSRPLAARPGHDASDACGRTSCSRVPLEPAGHRHAQDRHRRHRRRALGHAFCQFYATKDDLKDVLVPYFKAGLEADEFCMWVTSPPLDVGEAWDALAEAVPDLESYRRRGRIEIIPHTEWYLLGGRFEQDRVLKGWVTKLEDALARGCAGLRLTGNTFWLEKSDWRSFADYEAAVDRVLGQYRMLALCTYSVDRCGASEMADVIRNHQFALIKRDGRWEVFESFDRRRMQDALAVERERLAVTLQSIGDAVIATDIEGRVTSLNRVAEKLTGWSQAEAAGRAIGEVFRIVSEKTGEPGGRSRPRKCSSSGRSSVWRITWRSSRGTGTRRSPSPTAPLRSAAATARSLGVVLVFRDVTAERRAEEALRRERAARPAEAGQHPLSGRRRRGPGARRHHRRVCAPGAHGRVLQARSRPDGGHRPRGQGPGRRGMAGHLHEVPSRPSRDLQALHRERHPAHRRRPARANAGSTSARTTCGTSRRRSWWAATTSPTSSWGNSSSTTSSWITSVFQAQAARYGFERDAVPRRSTLFRA